MADRSVESYCLPIQEFSSQEHCGGKAFNLARVASLDLPVPDSFVIARSALNCFLEETGLQASVARYLTELAELDRREGSKAFEDLVRETLAAAIPDRIVEEIQPFAVSLLNSSPHGVAVRSSAVYEDSLRASFAGVFASYLAVGSIEELCRHVKLCWCSGWDPRAVQYGNRMGTPIEPDGMAVLVQQALAPGQSGVLFTADPMTGNPWRVVINSTFGLFQAAIDGEAPSDRYLLDWDTGSILEEEVAEKPTMQKPGRSGVVAEPVASSLVNVSSLNGENLRTLWSAAVEIDAAFEAPVDVEWALVDEHLIIVQARPVTALPEFFPHVLSDADKRETWLPSSPYWYIPAEVGGRVVAPLFRHIWDAENWARAVPEGLSLLSRNCRERDFNGHRYSTEGWSGISGDWLDILESRGEEGELRRIFETTEGRLDEIEGELREVWLKGERAVVASLDITREIVKHTTTARDLALHVLENIRHDPRGNYMGYGAPQSVGALCERMLKWFLRESLPDFQVERLLRGLPSHSHRRLVAAQELGRGIDEQAVREALASMPVEQVMPHLMTNHRGSRFLAEFEDFCWRFGQCPPSWSDRPAMWTTATVNWADFSSEVMVTVKRSHLGNTRDIRSIQSRNLLMREQAEREVIERLPPALRDQFEKLLNWARFWIPILDDRLWVGGCHHLIRYELLWHMATRLTAEGIIPIPEHVFLLTREDIEAFRTKSGEYLKGCYLANRLEYQRNKRLRPPPFLGRPPTETPGLDVMTAVMGSGEQEVMDGVLMGIGRSPGKVGGRARVVSGLVPADLDCLTDEDVMVCLEDIPYRVDWLGLFLGAKGLVAANRCGAGLHHAAQIARECGVVYVELPGELAERIPDGSAIELDGDLGEVRIPNQ